MVAAAAKTARRILDLGPIAGACLPPGPCTTMSVFSASPTSPGSRRSLSAASSTSGMVSPGSVGAARRCTRAWSRPMPMPDAAAGPIRFLLEAGRDCRALLGHPLQATVSSMIGKPINGTQPVQQALRARRRHPGRACPNKGAGAAPGERPGAERFREAADRRQLHGPSPCVGTRPWRRP